MNTDKIIKEYENAMAKYHAELPAHKKAMKKYLKKEKKFDKIAATLLTVNIQTSEPDGFCRVLSFFCTEQGFEELWALLDKVGIVREYPQKSELFKPTLEVRTKTDICPF